MSDVKTKIKEVLCRERQLASLATVTEDGKPWTRYVMIQANEDFEIRIATFLHSRKVGQIQNNQEVHFNCGIMHVAQASSYLQIQARAQVTTDEGERKALWHDSLKTYFKGADDPNYAVVICKPYRIEFMALGSLVPEVWEA
ncbi:MAG: pyridoxamine 5'-phosphate oxidase family protein [Planctomycetota bacterium]|jgi:general stress protein 26